MALTHQIAIQAAERWGEINLTMDLMFLAAHQITMALAPSSSTKDHCITGGVTAVGAAGMGATQASHLFT